MPNYSPSLSPSAAAASAAAASTAAAQAAAHAAIGGSLTPELFMQAAFNPLAARDALMMHNMALNNATSQLGALNLSGSGQVLPVVGSSCMPAGGSNAQLPPLVLPDESSWAQDTFVASLRTGSGALASPGSDSYSLWETSAALGCLHDAIHSSSVATSAAAVSGHTRPSPTWGPGGVPELQWYQWLGCEHPSCVHRAGYGWQQV